MALEIVNLQRAPEGGMYVSPERLCITADGEVCSEDDPQAVSLLVGKGCEIPAAQARQYGLIVDEPPAESGDAEPAGIVPAAPDGSAPDAAGEEPEKAKAQRRR